MNEQIKAGAEIHAGDGGYSESTPERYEAFAQVRNKSLAQARFRELAEQAHNESYQVYLARQQAEGPANVIFYDIFNARFAELIVRECCDLMKEYYTVVETEERNAQGNVVHRAVNAVSTLRKHFGVEE